MTTRRMDYSPHVGQTCGRWIIEGTYRDQNGHAWFNVVCSCGTKKAVRAHTVLGKKSLSCGCHKFEELSRLHRADHTGKRYGKLLVLHQLLPPSPPGKPVKWLCRCDCGREVIRGSGTFHTLRSCGCLRVKYRGVSTKRPGTHSRFKGVTFIRYNKMWRAECCKKHLGHFQVEEHAARAYDQAAVERWGIDNANTNERLGLYRKKVIRRRLRFLMVRGS